LHVFAIIIYDTIELDDGSFDGGNSLRELRSRSWGLSWRLCRSLRVHSGEQKQEVIHQDIHICSCVPLWWLI